VGEYGGLDVVEGLVDAETVGREGREDGGLGEVCGYGEGIGGDGSAVLFNEVGEKVESMVELLVVVHESSSAQRYLVPIALELGRFGLPFSCSPPHPDINVT
jgi:hypothetical protein